MGISLVAEHWSEFPRIRRQSIALEMHGFQQAFAEMANLTDRLIDGIRLLKPNETQD
jgi:hypothetical protein